MCGDGIGENGRVDREVALEPGAGTPGVVALVNAIGVAGGHWNKLDM